MSIWRVAEPAATTRAFSLNQTRSRSRPMKGPAVTTARSRVVVTAISEKDQMKAKDIQVGAEAKPAAK